MAQICAVLANIHRTKDAKVFEPSDFIPQLAPLEEENAAPAEPELIDLEATSAALMRMLGRKEPPP